MILYYLEVFFFQYYQLNLLQKKSQMKEIGQFIQKRIHEVQEQSKATNDKMERLKFAITSLSFANILNQYMSNNKYVFSALINLSKAYLETESYTDAIMQARLAKKQALKNPSESLQKATILIAQCMIKQNKFEDALQILKDLKIEEKNGEQNIKKFYELLLDVLVELRQEERVYEVLIKFEDSIKTKNGDKTNQYGFFLVKKGKSLGKFGKYNQAIENICLGIDILIERKCKQKKDITDIYLTLAEYYKKTQNIQKQYSSLICAHSMAKQISDPEKVLMIVHLLALNLIQRQEYTKALNQLRTAKNLQKEMYGQCSVQLGRTVKKIAQILNILNMKSEAKKYEQEYSRIVGLCTPLTNLRQKPLNSIKNT